MGLQGQVLIFVIPAKAGIQTVEAKFATRNQVRIADDKSLPPLWGLQGQALTFVIPTKAGIQTVEAKFATRNQVRIADDKSLPPLWGKARMGVSRASSPRPAASEFAIRNQSHPSDWAR